MRRNFLKIIPQIIIFLAFQNQVIALTQITSCKLSKEQLTAESEEQKNVSKIKYQIFNDYFKITSCVLAENFTTNPCYTFNLFATNKKFFLITGDYQVQHGTGLLLGQQSLMSGDPFAQGRRLEKNLKPKLISSGSPLYAFRGIFIQYNFKIKNWQITNATFFSAKKRFTKVSYLSNQILNTSLNSLEQHFLNEKDYLLPIYIHDYGYSLGICYKDKVLIQQLFWSMSLANQNDSILFYNNLNQEFSRLNGYSLFLSLNNRDFNIFSEISLTGNQNFQNKGYAFLNGLAFQSDKLTAQIAFKQLSQFYFAPHQSALSLEKAGKEFITTFNYKIFQKLKLTAKYSNQYPQKANCQKMLENKTIISINLSNHSKLSSWQISGNYINHFNFLTTENCYQIKTKYQLQTGKYFFWKMGSQHQYFNKSQANAISFSSKIKYKYIFIQNVITIATTQKETIYVALNSSFPTGISQNVFSYSANTGWQSKNLQFKIGFYSLKKCKETDKRNLEFFLTYIF